MMERVARGRDLIEPEEMLDAALYELGALNLEPKNRVALLEEVGLHEPVQCSSTNYEQYENAILGMFELITASREYQLG